MKKKLGLTLALLLTAVSGAYSATPRPAAPAFARACPELPPDCCQTKRISGCLVCTRQCF